MIMPDGNKPIKIGDTSFIYKGVYHPITWVGTEPYRPRVEMLVVKDRKYVYLRLKDDIDKAAPDKRKYKYTIPGGSLDADSSKLDQAVAETNEEALIKVVFPYNSGIQCYDRYEPGFLLKGGDMPIEYAGSISDVFVGVYDGDYDKSLVEEKDLDNDMAEHGKFHEIKSVAKYLCRAHIDALLHCQFIDTESKAALQLYRLDTISESVNDKVSPILVPGDKLYHGTTCEIELFQPMSLDLGNVFQNPGWSTFCFADYNFAKLFAAAKAFTKLFEESRESGDDTDVRVEFLLGYLVMTKECFEYVRDLGLLDIKVKFYVYTINSEGLDVGIGNDPALKEYTFRESGVKPEKVDEFQLSLMDLKELVEISDESLDDRKTPDESEYKGLLSHNYRTETEVRNELQKAIADGKLKPGDDIKEFIINNDLELSSDDIHLPDLSMEADMPVLEKILSPSFLRAVGRDYERAKMIGETKTVFEKFPDDCYGLPERKAYPMPDEEHVRSAIKFFNYVKADEEKELANAINANIQKFKITNINVGKKNRFKKYYRPVIENISLSDILKSMEDYTTEVTSDAFKTLAPDLQYRIYDKGKGLVRMMIVRLNNDDADEELKNPSYKDQILNGCYNALAEIAVNQTECLALMESKDIRTLNLSPVMEADADEEEPESATDYTAMADEQGAEGEDDPDEATGGEGATDYTAMADDQGAEDDEEPAGGEGDDTEETGEEDTGEGDGEEATDYTAMADDQGAEEGDEGNDNEVSDDNPADEGSEDSDSEETVDTAENNENDKRYNNKEIKNYFLLNNFLSMHQTSVDVLDTVNGVVLPSPDANRIMAKVVKNLQGVKTFIEKFIQFQFSEKDYAFNLYYYNLLMNVLRINLKLFEAAVKISDEGTKNKEKEE